MSFATISNEVLSVIGLVAPVLAELDPPLSGVITIATALAKGVATAEPTAVSLIASLSSTTPPTPAQLQAYAAAAESAYQQFNAALAASTAAAVAAA